MDPSAARKASVWTRPNAIERLVVLWTQERRSFRVIAEALSDEFGVAITRNAVIGKLDRLGLMGQGGRRKRAKTPSSARAAITLPGGRAFRDGAMVEEVRS